VLPVVIGELAGALERLTGTGDLLHQSLPISSIVPTGRASVQLQLNPGDQVYAIRSGASDAVLSVLLS
jgi:hypothetical protein